MMGGLFGGLGRLHDVATNYPNANPGSMGPPAPVNTPDSAESIIAATAGAAKAFVPLLTVGDQTAIAKDQAALALMQQKNALTAANATGKTKDYTPWILGIGGAALIAIVVVGILKKK